MNHKAASPRADRIGPFTDSVAQAFDNLLPVPLPDRIGLAVSGGSDSTALLHLAAAWAAKGKTALHVVTVDHGLRPEAAQEASDVAAQSDALGLPHTTLQWSGGDGTGNLMDRARRARYALMANWALAHDISHIALGHTADDVAENLLMRLAREAGVDGLSAMAPSRRHENTEFFRPLLSFKRNDLRDYLTARNQTWADDPSNQDTRYDRVRARKILAALEPLGVSVDGLARVASNLGDVRNALNWYAFLAARDCARVEQGDVLFCLRQLRVPPDEITRRLLVQALCWVSGAEYAPRRRAVQQLQEGLFDARGMALHGCRAVYLTGADRGLLRICRDPRAAAETTAAPGHDWAGRWRVDGPWPQGAEIRATGSNGLKELENWRASGLPEPAAQSAPAVWRGDQLIASPLLGKAAGWAATPLRQDEEFFNSCLIS